MTTKPYAPETALAFLRQISTDGKVYIPTSVYLAAGLGWPIVNTEEAMKKLIRSGAIVETDSGIYRIKES